MNFSPAQRQMLADLDGKGYLKFSGRSVRTIKALARMGLVTYERERHLANSVHGARILYRVCLLQPGADLIYNGGIDH